MQIETYHRFLVSYLQRSAFDLQVNRQLPRTRLQFFFPTALLLRGLPAACTNQSMLLRTTSSWPHTFATSLPNILTPSALGWAYFRATKPQFFLNSPLAVMIGTFANTDLPLIFALPSLPRFTMASILNFERQVTVAVVVCQHDLGVIFEYFGQWSASPWWCGFFCSQRLFLRKFARWTK
jgi:hypothetical protein